MPPPSPGKNRLSSSRPSGNPSRAPTGTRTILIDLGKLIFAKKSLKDIAAQDEKKFARIFPHLVEIVNHLAAKMMEATAAAQAHQAATAPPQAPIPPQAPQALGTFKPIAIAGGPQVLAPQAPQAPAPSQLAAIQPPAGLPVPVPPQAPAPSQPATIQPPAVLPVPVPPQAPAPSQLAAIQPPAGLPAPVPPTPESGANQ